MKFVEWLLSKNQIPIFNFLILTGLEITLANFAFEVINVLQTNTNLRKQTIFHLITETFEILPAFQ